MINFGAIATVLATNNIIGNRRREEMEEQDMIEENNAEVETSSTSEDDCDFSVGDIILSIVRILISLFALAVIVVSICQLWDYIRIFTH